MPGNSKTLLCGYSYDPLNRLVANTSTTQADTQRFYFHDRLATEIQAGLQHSILQYNDQLLAQQLHRNGAVNARLLATDQQRSVAHVLEAILRPLAYTPYGHRPVENGLLGFTGEWPAPETGWYLLGKGYRVYNPVLMRFHSPDNLSPFGKGVFNTYAYCLGDPVNQHDPDGHFPRPTFRGLRNLLRRIFRRGRANRTQRTEWPTEISEEYEVPRERLVVNETLLSATRGARAQVVEKPKPVLSAPSKNPSDYDGTVAQIRKQRVYPIRSGKLNKPVKNPQEEKAIGNTFYSHSTLISKYASAVWGWMMRRRRCSTSSSVSRQGCSNAPQ